MRAAKWRLTLRVITALIWIVSVIWLVTEPGFEPLIGFLGGLIPLIASLTESDSARSTDWRADIARRNRETLLKRLQQDSEAMLQDPLQEVQRVALGMELQPDAVNPLAAMPRLTDDAAQPLRSGTTIAQVFEGCQDGLLILGAPGAGKTTLLHELAIELLNRAGHTDHAAIPVIFNLASWAQEQKSLEEWLVDEFALRFQNRAYGQELVDGNALLLLLDGLDEVRADARAACVSTINAYRAADRGFVQIVVCARQAEYAQVQKHVSLALDSAVLLQPLTDDQVDAYLVQGGDRLAALRDMIAADDQLREWAHTPLWLSVMTVAYGGKSVEDVQALMRDGAGRKHLFEQYVEEIFRLKAVRDESECKQITHWLAWLAHQMRQRNSTEFYIEELQPDWLPTERHKEYRRALMWNFGLAGGLLDGLAGALAIWLLFGLVFGVIIASILASTSGLVFGLTIGLTAGKKPDIETAEQLRFAWFPFIDEVIEEFYRKRKAVLRTWLAGGLVIGLPVAFANGPLFGLLTGFLVGAAMGFGYGWAQGLTSGLKRSLTTTSLETQASPNQGIRRSVRSALTGGLVYGLAYGLAYGPAFGLVFGPWVGLERILGHVLILTLFGILLGSQVGGVMLYGGLAVIQHLRPFRENKSSKLAAV